MGRTILELEREGLAISPAEKRQLTKPLDPKTAHAEMLRHPHLADDMTQVLLGHVWYIYANERREPLYMSDHPLSFRSFEPSTLRGTGPASFGAELSYPLSPGYMITLIERTWAAQNLGRHFWLDGSLLGSLTRENIEYQRSLQISGSYRYLYCSSNDFDLAADMCRKDPRLRQPGLRGLDKEGGRTNTVRSAPDPPGTARTPRYLAA